MFIYTYTYTVSNQGFFLYTYTYMYSYTYIYIYIYTLRLGMRPLAGAPRRGNRPLRNLRKGPSAEGPGVGSRPHRFGPLLPPPPWDPGQVPHPKMSSSINN